MINRSKQDWTVGNTVKVGFLSLTVLAVVPTPGDSKPDAYVLASKTAFYEFVPHNGLNRIEASDAQDLINEGCRQAGLQAAAAVAKASVSAAHAALIHSMVAA
jgi:hypothetical protein